MIVSTSNFTAFGISMQRRSTRRKLVVLTYVVLALVCGLASWFAQGNPSAFSYAIWAALLVTMFVFGGQGRYGLIKPFLNKAPGAGGRDPIDRMVFPDPVLLQLADTVPLPESHAEWKNDERELSRRDHAHDLAYQPLGVAFVLVLLLVSEALHRPGWLSLNVTLSLIYVIALFSSVSAITLPAAIILWTEPDLN